jgi:uncharacterized membrane protein (DUF373 family)
MMRMLRKLKVLIIRDEIFLKTIESIEIIIAKFLSIAMVLVTFIALTQLSYALVDKLIITFKRPTNEDFNATLFELFGLVLNVLIALEILANITAYLRKNVTQIELVIVTSLIAVARKIIILDLEKKSSGDLVALAVAVFSLSISYAIVDKCNYLQNIFLKPIDTAHSNPFELRTKTRLFQKAGFLAIASPQFQLIFIECNWFI